MRELSAALDRRLLPRLTDDPPRADGMRTWLEAGSFYIDSNSNAENITIQNVALADLLPYIAFDHERFALSSIESVLFSGSGPKRPKALAWTLLRLYYAAFFGAHAVMRATGSGVIRVDGRLARRFSTIASLFVPNLVVAAGTFDFQIIQRSDRSIAVTLKKLPDSGGAHDQFWRRFYSYLTDIGSAVAANNEPQATSIVGEISAIQSVLAASGLSAGTWLSAIRNEINYQHAHNVWFPYGLATNTVTSVRRMIARPSGIFRLDYDASKEPILAFCAICHFVTAMNVDISDILAKRGGTRRFATLWNRVNAETVG